LIATLLGIQTGARHPALELTPEHQKQRTLEALVDQLEGLAAEQPVLVVHEDVHWIDPTTQELLSLAIERIPRLPILLLITFRPEFVPPWPSYTHVATLTLTSLGRPQSEELVHELTDAKTLPREVRDQILANADGVPLFVEELTKTVLESGLLADAGDHYELSGPLLPPGIPATLDASLMARLDRLASVKEVAQIAAVIGREFSYELLAAVAEHDGATAEPMSGAELTQALDQLVTSELVSCRGEPPDATYTFKHALVRHAAYDSLLNSKRRQLHGCLGQVLEGRIPETIKHQPELLAHHFTEAGLTQRAMDYWHSAGQRAVARFAQKEATANFIRALELHSKPANLTIRFIAGGTDLTVFSKCGTITFDWTVIPWDVRQNVERYVQESLLGPQEPQARLAATRG
jgi:predicted ATPase